MASLVRVTSLTSKRAGSPCSAGGRRGRGVPERRQVFSDIEDTLPFLRAQATLAAAGNAACSRQLLNRREFLVPVLLQIAGHQAVLRLDGQEASPRQVGLVARPFQAELPLPFDLARLLLDLLGMASDTSGLGRLQGLEQTDHCRIHAIAADELTGATTLLLVDLVALVAGRGAVAGIAHTHASAALAAQHETLQQGLTFAHGTAAVVPSVGAVVVEDWLLIAQGTAPRDVARVSVVTHVGQSATATRRVRPLTRGASWGSARVRVCVRP